MVDMYLGKPNTLSNIAWHRPQSAASRVEEELIQKSIRAASQATDPLEKLRLLCFSRGATGILVLARIFRSIDDGSHKLSKEKFIGVLQKTNLEMTQEESEELFNKFDTDNSGSVNLDEFIKELRPPMSESRRAVVERSFKKLDKTGEGLLSVEDIRRVYSMEAHPRYMSGEETADVVMTRFLANFEPDGDSGGTVTLEEFMNYYSGISVSIDNDCYFDLMMRQCYKL
ncbi:PREDICTED: calcyphosin-like protein [Papilio polytes]|uniref:calcyphosin-like protein n=1 Tax=Papilio polytes TaxID=76194 RepID=UPI000675C12D|nr:PREDICTED: calcyphosin-like protein [Papilio polytes]